MACTLILSCAEKCILLSKRLPEWTSWWRRPPRARSAPSAAAERVAEYCWVPPLPNLHGPSAARAGAMVEKAGKIGVAVGRGVTSFAVIPEGGHRIDYIAESQISEMSQTSSTTCQVHEGSYYHFCDSICSGGGCCRGG